MLHDNLTFFVYPYIARGIRKFGERKMLSWEYASLFVVFLGYAIFDSPIVAAVLYVFDRMFFWFRNGINTYFQKIAKPEVIAPSISTAYAINHISAIVIPIIGGALWLLNWRIPFVAGALLAVVSFGFVQKIKVPVKQDL
jgi:MFS family permease